MSFHSFGSYSEPNLYKPSNKEGAQSAEFKMMMQKIYGKAINEFRECSMILSSTQESNQSKENSILRLNNTIDGSLIQFKSLKKSLSKEKSSIFSKTMEGLLQNFSQTISGWNLDFTCQRALQEPLEKFQRVLRFETDFMVDESLNKSNKYSPRKESQHEVQQLLDMTKETYDRTIAGFNDYLKCLQARSSGIQAQANKLNLTIDTASLQLRALLNKFPQDLNKHLFITFERMSQDFQRFCHSIPEILREKLAPFILGFEQAINIDQLMQRNASFNSAQNHIIVKNERNNKESLTSSIKNNYDLIMKSMLECIRLAQKKNSRKGFSSEESNLSVLLKEAEEDFESIKAQKLSSKEKINLIALIHEIKNDWDQIQGKVLVTQCESLESEYFRFSTLLKNLKGRLD